MAKFTKNDKKKNGLPDGSPVQPREKKAERPRIKIIDFSEDYCMHKPVQHIEACRPYKETEATTWITVDGLHDASVVEAAGKLFDIHALVQRDILHPGRRPKIEVFDDSIYLSLRMLDYDEVKERIREEPLSIVLGKNYVIFCHEQPADALHEVRERIIKDKTDIRKQKAGYLAYALLDAVVDSYFGVLGQVEQKQDRLEKELFSGPSTATPGKIDLLKKQIVQLRRLTWPLGEIVNVMLNEGDAFLEEAGKVYYRDVYNRIIHIIDVLETMRETVADMQITYQALLNQRMAEGIRFIAVIAAVFLPLTFIAGVYGMNFRFMPELEWQWGYFGVLGGMVMVVVGMIFYFRRKNWF